MLECCPEERLQICHLGSRGIVGQLLERVRGMRLEEEERGMHHKYCK